MGVFRVCLASMNGEQVSRQAWESLIPWLVLFVFALLGWISCQKKKKIMWTFFCICQLFLVLKP